MVIALVAGLLLGFLGWVRATRRGGNRADRVQYALAHGFAGFLVSMIAMTIAGHLGAFG
ncbi:MAG: hypothetical protein AAFN27_02505 [Pseudomonadota bacterium]